MNINEQIKNAETAIHWIAEYKSNGDPYQQKRAMQSLLEVIKALSNHINDMSGEIEKLKNEVI